MVILGGFSARLVDATSKEPLREHIGPTDGQVYTEVEPDSDYYIEVQVTGEKIKPKRKICFQFVVDGTKLESRTITNKKSGPGLVGLLSRKNGAVINRALRFKKSSTRRRNPETYTVCPKMVLGSVIVTVSDAVPVKTKPSQDDFQEELEVAQREPVLCNSYGGLKEILRSSKGMVVSGASSPSKKGSAYLPGKLLEEIKINYGTTLDLIYTGILPQPPLWEFHRLKHGLPPKNSRDGTNSPVLPTPKRIKLDAVYDSKRSMVVPPREVELFDLTGENIDISHTSRPRSKSDGTEEGCPISVPGLIYSP